MLIREGFNLFAHISQLINLQQKVLESSSHYRFICR
jgi:hypothetical protein